MVVRPCRRTNLIPATTVLSRVQARGGHAGEVRPRGLWEARGRVWEGQGRPPGHVQLVWRGEGYERGVWGRAEVY